MTTTLRSAPHRRRALLAVGIAVLALIATACGSDDDSAGTVAPTSVGNTGPAEITVSAQWARTSPMDAANGAAYAIIACPTDDALVGVAVDATVAEKVELHETVMSGMTGDTAMGMGSDTTMGMGGTTMPGQMTMQPVDRIECTAAAGAELQPGGYHIMLFGLVEPLKVGDTVSITLTFEAAGEMVVEFPVLEEAP